MAYDIQQSTTQSALLFFMVASSDHISALTGASPTVTLSKNGAAFASPSGAVTEIANGWYKVAGNATDTATLGPLALHATAASGDPCDILVANIVAYNPQTANLGLTNVSANVAQWNGSNVSAPATAGIPDINVKNMNNVAATSITTINANQGTTQPLNFTGTAGSALVKSDMVDIAGAAVSATTAQIGANVVQVNGQTATAAAGVTFPSSIASPTNITAGTITTVTNLTNAPTAGDFTATMKTSIGTAVAASAVASVTGNVGGNVTGSVGSVAAAVTVLGTSALTEAYPAQGAALTLASALYSINQFLSEHSTGGTTTWTVKKRDRSTTAKTYTLDSATTPTSLTEAS